MSALDQVLPGVALRLIEQFGKRVVYRTPGGTGEYDPETGTAAVTPPAERRMRMLVEDFPALQAAAGASSEDGVRRGDKKLTAAAGSFRRSPPEPDHEVGVDGVFYRILQVDAVYAGEKVALYVLQGRR
jgi:hypothetical protein